MVMGLLVLLDGSAGATVIIDWVTVGAPRNSPDYATGYGAVPYEYRISKYEITNAQYAEFLNAVATTDTNELYNTEMASFGGIFRWGTAENYLYYVVPGRANMPVTYVSFYDCLRFANWLHNGQPTGVQDNTTTESGAYRISSINISRNSITRWWEATIAIPSEDEWYKAAYFEPGRGFYFDYPTGTSTRTLCRTPGATANTANCRRYVDDLTEVGSYTGSASPNGTFDQAGNAWEWNEAIIDVTDRELRGGSFLNSGGFEATDSFRTSPTREFRDVGFRIVSAPVPEPSRGLSLTALLILAWMKGRRISSMPPG